VSLRSAVTARRLSLIASAVVLLALTAAPAHAAFPGENGKIAVTHYSVPDRLSWSIDTMNADGSARRELTSGGAAAWSADGTKIAFGRGAVRDGVGWRNAAVYLMNADGSGESLVTSGGVQELNPRPSLSPDGRRIVFERCVQGSTGGCIDSDLFTSNIDGSGVELLVGRFGLDSDPDWSPDGSKIVFWDDNGIWVVNADKTGLRHICCGEFPSWSCCAESPSWSPNSSKIVFQSNRHVPRPCELCPDEIYVMNADGSGQTRLTNDPLPEWFPTWSPDGKKIAWEHLYCAPSCTGADIYVMNADGTGAVNVTNNGPGSGDYEIYPDWQPIPGPRRSDFKNASKFCKAEREFLGDEAFRQRYGGGANAHGKCVSRN
jgi:TolB protein